MSPAPREHVLLIGSMGVGKSTIGRVLSLLLDRAFRDSDDDLLAEHGESAAAVLEQSGREALHRLEVEVLAHALGASRPSVIAVAAGVVDSPEGRELVSQHTAIYLRARSDTLLARVGDGAGRPLGGDPIEVIERLEGPRRSLYEQLATDSVDVDRGPPEVLAASIAKFLRRRVEVSLGDRSYPVLIGPGVRNQLVSVLPERARKVAIVTQEHIGVDVDPGREHAVFLIGDGESAKSMATIERLCRDFANFGLTRADVVVALGGGVVTDAAGFAAACYHRGTAYVNVSTTLLGQIDAAVGGKTAVNIPEGKNLIGAFWQPAAVLCDTDTLVTLPEREWRSGLGEMVKYAFLGVDNLDRLSLVEQVAACTKLKAEVVSEDEREGDRRMLLNYGHTLAHALEAAGFADGPGRDGIDLRHGEAVAIGIAFAARLANLLGRIDEERVTRHLDLLTSCELPTEIPAGVDVEEVLWRMGRDKKATSGLTFILDGPVGVEIVPAVAEDAIRVAFAATSAGSSGSVV